MSHHTKAPRWQELETLGVIAAFLLLLALVTHRQWLSWLALALLVIGLFVPPLARPLTSGWLKLSTVIGTFNSKVILTLVFYGFLTPLAFLYRLMGKDPLQLRDPAGRESFYSERNHTYSRGDLDKMW
jgi:polyferredoxin